MGGCSCTHVRHKCSTQCSHGIGVVQQRRDVEFRLLLLLVLPLALPPASLWLGSGAAPAAAANSSNATAAQPRQPWPRRQLQS
jgi:hypothetical protein